MYSSTRQRFVGFRSMYASYSVSRYGQCPSTPLSLGDVDPLALRLRVLLLLLLMPRPCTLWYRFLSSRAKELAYSCVRPKSLGIFLMATRRIVGKCSALYTWPKAPPPKRLLPGVPSKAKLLPAPFKARKPASPCMQCGFGRGVCVRAMRWKSSRVNDAPSFPPSCLHVHAPLPAPRRRPGGCRPCSGTG